MVMDGGTCKRVEMKLWNYLHVCAVNYFVFVILHSMSIFCISSCMAPFPGQTQRVSEWLGNCLCVIGSMCACARLCIVVRI